METCIGRAAQLEAVRQHCAHSVQGFSRLRVRGGLVTTIQGQPSEIHELARYEVRPEALEECLAAIHEFVAYVRANESGALRYEVWQEMQHPTRFVHIFVWRDQEANRIHGESAAVKKFAGILYPNCLAPVEFTEYKQIDANARFRRI
jgi:quinol monooxygenase YgiN